MAPIIKYAHDSQPHADPLSRDERKDRLKIVERGQMWEEEVNGKVIPENSIFHLQWMWPGQSGCALVNRIKRDTSPFFTFQSPNFA